MTLSIASSYPFTRRPARARRCCRTRRPRRRNPPGRRSSYPPARRRRGCEDDGRGRVGAPVERHRTLGAVEKDVDLLVGRGAPARAAAGPEDCGCGEVPDDDQAQVDHVHRRRRGRRGRRGARAGRGRRRRCAAMSPRRDPVASSGTSISNDWPLVAHVGGPEATALGPAKFCSSRIQRCAPARSVAKSARGSGRRRGATTRKTVLMKSFLTSAISPPSADEHARRRRDQHVAHARARAPGSSPASGRRRRTPAA